MYGAIIGDLAGSIYEFNETKKITKINLSKDLIAKNSFFSDDTILTIAILDAILNNKNYEFYLKKYGNEFLSYKPSITPYFKTAFSPNFIKWIKGDNNGFSSGNGAMMRISPVGYLFNSEKEIIENSILATITSHNNEDSIKNATIVALIIYWTRKGLTKKEILKKLNITLKYEPFLKFNTTCGETINNCLYALFNSNSFEESIRKIISYGGDTDTNACIVGSMAEAFYGIDKSLIEEANKKIPSYFVKKLQLGYQKIK